MEQVSPQSPTQLYCYGIQYRRTWVVYSSIVNSVNNHHPDNNGETGEYFCIYCTFVTKNSQIFICIDSIQHVKYHLLCFIKRFVLDVPI